MDYIHHHHHHQLQHTKKAFEVRILWGTYYIYIFIIYDVVLYHTYQPIR